MIQRQVMHAQVVAVTAVRTGAGKSQVSSYVIDVLKEQGLQAVLVRHPMPYGALPPASTPILNSFETLLSA